MPAGSEATHKPFGHTERSLISLSLNGFRGRYIKESSDGEIEEGGRIDRYMGSAGGRSDGYGSIVEVSVGECGGASEGYNGR